MKKLTTAALPAALLLTLAAAPVTVPASIPGPADSPPQAIVNYADLDLSTAKGVDRLYRRLRNAAATVCPAMSRDPNRNLQAAACRQEVLDAAIARIDAAPLSRLHADRQARRLTRLAGL
jgi:UrcA family protein